MQANDHYENLPDDLVDELRKIDAPTAMITARVDREIDALAARHFGARQRREWPRPAAWATAAAAALLAVVLLQLREPGTEGSPTTLADLDGSGQVDIADVLYLARQPGASQAEIDAFAMQLVSLAGEREAS